MYLKKAIFIIVAVSIIFGFLPDKTLAKGVTAGVKIGSLGVGSEISYKINSYFDIRAMGGYFRKNKSITSSDVNYDFTLKLFSAGLMIDLHPFEGSFRVSAGVLYNGNKLWGDATPSEGNTTYTINGHTYQLTKLSASIKYHKAAPYLGIGWNTSFSKNSGLGFSFDLGVMYQGKSKVSLTAYGSSEIINSQEFQYDLQQAKDSLKNDADKLKFWPVIMIGLNYKFF